MRIGSTVLIQEGQCLQSYGWNIFRKLGSLQHVLDSLGEYECDEISILRPVRADDSPEFFARDVELLSDIKTVTPTSFGGGIRSLAQLEQLSNLPIERFTFSSAFINKDETLLSVANEIFGKQAIQCVLPISSSEGLLRVFVPSINTKVDVVDLDWEFINQYADEIVVYDTDNEGYSDRFNLSQLALINAPYSKLVLTGGIGASTVRAARSLGVASVLIDNRVLYRECSMEYYRNG